MKELTEALKNLPKQLALKFDLNTFQALATHVVHFKLIIFQIIMT